MMHKDERDKNDLESNPWRSREAFAKALTTDEFWEKLNKLIRESNSPYNFSAWTEFENKWKTFKYINDYTDLDLLKKSEYLSNEIAMLKNSLENIEDGSKRKQLKKELKKLEKQKTDLAEAMWFYLNGTNPIDFIQKKLIDVYGINEEIIQKTLINSINKKIFEPKKTSNHLNKYSVLRMTDFIKNTLKNDKANEDNSIVEITPEKTDKNGEKDKKRLVVKHANNTSYITTSELSNKITDLSGKWFKWLFYRKEQKLNTFIKNQENFLLNIENVERLKTTAIRNGMFYKHTTWEKLLEAHTLINAHSNNVTVPKELETEWKNTLTEKRKLLVNKQLDLLEDWINKNNLDDIQLFLNSKIAADTGLLKAINSNIDQLEKLIPKTDVENIDRFNEIKQIYETKIDNAIDAHTPKAIKKRFNSINLIPNPSQENVEENINREFIDREFKLLKFYFSQQIKNGVLPDEYLIPDEYLNVIKDAIDKYNSTVKNTYNSNTLKSILANKSIKEKTVQNLENYEIFLRSLVDAFYPKDQKESGHREINSAKSNRELIFNNKVKVEDKPNNEINITKQAKLLYEIVQHKISKASSQNNTAEQAAVEKLNERLVSKVDKVIKQSMQLQLKEDNFKTEPILKQFEKVKLELQQELSLVNACIRTIPKNETTEETSETPEETYLKNYRTFINDQYRLLLKSHINLLNRSLNKICNELLKDTEQSIDPAKKYDKLKTFFKNIQGKDGLLTQIKEFQDPHSTSTVSVDQTLFNYLVKSIQTNSSVYAQQNIVNSDFISNMSILTEELENSNNDDELITIKEQLTQIAAFESCLATEDNKVTFLMQDVLSVISDPNFLTNPKIKDYPQSQINYLINYFAQGQNIENSLLQSQLDNLLEQVEKTLITLAKQDVGSLSYQSMPILSNCMTWLSKLKPKQVESMLTKINDDKEAKTNIDKLLEQYFKDLMQPQKYNAISKEDMEKTFRAFEYVFANFNPDKVAKIKRAREYFQSPHIDSVSKTLAHAQAIIGDNVNLDTFKGFLNFAELFKPDTFTKENCALLRKLNSSDQESVVTNPEELKNLDVMLEKLYTEYVEGQTFLPSLRNKWLDYLKSGRDLIKSRELLISKSLDQLTQWSFVERYNNDAEKNITSKLANDDFIRNSLSYFKILAHTNDKDTILKLNNLINQLLVFHSDRIKNLDKPETYKSEDTIKSLIYCQEVLEFFSESSNIDKGNLQECKDSIIKMQKRIDDEEALAKDIAHKNDPNFEIEKFIKIVNSEKDQDINQAEKELNKNLSGKINSDKFKQIQNAKIYFQQEKNKKTKSVSTTLGHLEKIFDKKFNLDNDADALRFSKLYMPDLFTEDFQVTSDNYSKLVNEQSKAYSDAGWFSEKLKWANYLNRIINNYDQEQAKKQTASQVHDQEQAKNQTASQLHGQEQVKKQADYDQEKAKEQAGSQLLATFETIKAAVDTVSDAKSSSRGYVKSIETIVAELQEYIDNIEVFSQLYQSDNKNISDKFHDDVEEAVKIHYDCLKKLNDLFNTKDQQVKPVDPNDTGYKEYTLDQKIKPADPKDNGLKEYTLEQQIKPMLLSFFYSKALLKALLNAAPESKFYSEGTQLLDDSNKFYTAIQNKIKSQSQTKSGSMFFTGQGSTSTHINEKPSTNTNNTNNTNNNPSIPGK